MTLFSLTRDEVRELDRRAIEGFGVPGIVLMENAGRGCAELLMTLNPEKKPVAILCGPGNNGGDGFVIARHLDNYGVKVGVWLFTDPGRLVGDAAINQSIVTHIHSIPTIIDYPSGDVQLVDSFTQKVFHPGMWIVDALFGTGLSRELATPYSVIISSVNRSNAPVLAIDIPSGLD